MTIGEQIRYDLITMIEEDPTTFSFGGVDYRGASSGLTRRRPLEVGGFEEAPALTIAVNLFDVNGGAVFGQDIPKVGDRMTVGGKTYRVDRSEIDSLGECLQLDLASKDK